MIHCIFNILELNCAWKPVSVPTGGFTWNLRLPDAFVFKEVGRACGVHPTGLAI